MLPQLRPVVSRLHYAWIIVAVTFVAVIVTAGVRATPGVLIVPLEQEFHWSRATISFASASISFSTVQSDPSPRR
jgi:hypothetical protein